MKIKKMIREKRIRVPVWYLTAVNGNFYKPTGMNQLILMKGPNFIVIDWLHLLAIPNRTASIEVAMLKNTRVNIM